MNVIKSEFYKLKISRPFYICLFVCAALVAFFGISIQRGEVRAENYWISVNITALASLTPESGAVLQGVIVGLCYLAGGTIVGSVLFKKTDIK